ncbi:diguanylate cyclase VdcA [Abditibacteriota bacterium]|nr:diguanylate cyclase VdcA [Abditibacteriota bacterium]
MNAPRFDRDKITGLWTWPVLLNGDWSQWTANSCAVLYGETNSSGSDDTVLRKMSELLRSHDWPHVTAFRVGQIGFLILASFYSLEQASLLGEWVNRELGQLINLTPSSETPRVAALTWGIAIGETQHWSLPRVLESAVNSVERAISEKRWGSINEATDTREADRPQDDFWICSHRDPLTELKMWSRTIALCCHYADEPVVLLMGGMDGFRHFNCSHGHMMGDLLLQMIAHVLRRFESNDVVTFRMGGDEFLVWVRGYSLERAKQLAEQISAQIRALQLPVTCLDPSLPSQVDSVSLTWSVVAASSRELDLQVMIRKADELLYQAKSEQRGSVNAQRL